ncbi:hypothetical protein PVAP13_4KG010081 [Panicum virgatum]|uniref:Uncharacterized protein n=1 Tax=Panicum virgatum TaxID=38727 RepID=A0A8T0TAT1_PANVG|nr:hypothetical protein PVAP13_4KG010081 [Panicum virgatum]
MKRNCLRVTPQCIWSNSSSSADRDRQTSDLPSFHVSKKQRCKNNDTDRDCNHTIRWSQHEIQTQSERDHETSSCVLQQKGRKIEVVGADGDVHSRHPGVDEAEGSHAGADECQSVGQDKGIEGIAAGPSKHGRPHCAITSGQRES